MEIKVLTKTPIAFGGGAAGKENFFRLEHWTVDRDGEVDDRIVWKRGKFVLVVAITADNQVVLIREYKQAVEKTLTGLPAGAIKKNETPQEAAQRELMEETGYSGNFRDMMGPFYNSPDKSTEEHFVMVISDAVKTDEPKPEKSETILSVDEYCFDSAMLHVCIGLHLLALRMARP